MSPFSVSASCALSITITPHLCMLTRRICTTLYDAGVTRLDVTRANTFVAENQKMDVSTVRGREGDG
jgi:hypothetical protein